VQTSAFTPLVCNEMEDPPTLCGESDVLSAETRQIDENEIEIGMSLYIDVAVWRCV